jgi:hypothetical protein
MMNPCLAIERNVNDDARRGDDNASQHLRMKNQCDLIVATENENPNACVMEIPFPGNEH